MSLKNRPVATILTSAYLSAMLTSSLAPIRNNTIFAAAVDPMAAEKALQNAVSGLDVAGWAAAGTPAPSQPTSQPVPVKVTPKADPVMTEELMARLIKYTRGVKDSSTLSARLCKVLDLCDGTSEIQLKAAESESTDGHHYFATPLDPKSKDVFIIVIHDERSEVYLTDKTGKLRAAAVVENDAARLITNEKAATKFKAELSLFAGEASTLPPTGTAVAGNS